MSQILNFNASVFMPERIENSIKNIAEELAHRVVEACGEHYGFDASEAKRLLGLNTVSIERKMSKKMSPKKNREAVVKPAFPLPYNGELEANCCQALRQNNGLYTQCQSSRKGESDFCKACIVLAGKSSDGVPEYGTISQRQAVGIFEYVDPKGRKPVAYVKVMKKYKVSEEQVLLEAGKFGINLDRGHFEMQVESRRGRPKSNVAAKASQPKGPKGRPKKTKKVLSIEGDEEDLFASLVASASSPIELEDESKSAERLAKEQEKEAQRLAKEQEKAAKELEKAAKEQEKAAKEQQKDGKSVTKSPKKEEVVEEEAEVVKKIEFEGKKYLKSKKSGVIYGYAEYLVGDQVVLGVWDETNKRILFNKVESESEEEEEDYEEEDE